MASAARAIRFTPTPNAAFERAVKALALNHVAFGTADVSALTAYYEEVVGLHVTARHDGRVYLASRSGTEAVILSADDATRLHGVALLAGSGEVSVATLATRGVAAERRSDPHPGVAESVVFTDPDGFAVELLPEPCLHAPGPVRGAAPLRLGHVAVAVRDVNRTKAFYESVLGFGVGDWIGTHFVFMRCGHEHHTLNFVQSETSRMQHIAFEMQNAAALAASCDVLAQAGLRLLWGPVRHGPGHNIASYHANNAGQIIELFAEMDMMSNEALGYYDPRPWHADRPQRPKVWPPVDPARDVWGPAGPEGFLRRGV